VLGQIFKFITRKPLDKYPGLQYNISMNIYIEALKAAFTGFLITIIGRYLFGLENGLTIPERLGIMALQG
jgi:hypothetical protein